MQLFFDLDGTLIDSLPRMFRLFCEMCPECTFSRGEYADVKRRRMTQAQLLKNYFHYDDVRIAAFHKKWLEKIEEPERMLEDRPFPGITELLTELSCGRDLYIPRLWRASASSPVRSCVRSRNGYPIFVGWKQYPQLSFPKMTTSCILFFRAISAMASMSGFFPNIIPLRLCSPTLHKTFIINFLPSVSF